MTSVRNLYYAKGKLSVTAKGYWYSGGGVKGSFGYFPHLKDASGFPVYPDTLVKGNIRTACCWNQQLNGIQNPLLHQVLGQEGDSDSGLLKISDLTLSEASRKIWSNENFQIKTRIKIDEFTRSVSKHFLVDLELAFLDGLELEADIFIGYFDTIEDRDQWLSFFEEAICLIPGFGALRSRGYGRGTVNLALEKGETPEYEIKSPSHDQTGLTYVATAFTHFKNRLPGTGILNFIPTENIITREQFKGWFVKIWQRIYDEWLSYNELQKIQFPDLYPARIGNSGKITLSIPPPMTTLINEEGAIKDYWKMSDTVNSTLEHESFLRSKTKPLSSGHFVARDGSVAIAVEKQIRTRNQLNDHFLTEEGSLFTQEMVTKGTVFAGYIDMRSADETVYSKAQHILRHINPVINGTLFLSSTTNAGAAREEKDPAPDHPFVVTRPIRFEFDMIAAENNIKLDNQKRYHTQLKRPRRNQVTVAPGSLLDPSKNRKWTNDCLPWPGLGQNTVLPLKTAGETVEKIERQAIVKDPNLGLDTKTLAEDTIKFAKKYPVSKSQAGLLRNLLNPGNSQIAVEQFIQEKKEKLSAREGEATKKLIEELEKIKNKKEIEGMRSWLKSYLDALAVVNWDKANKP